MKFLYVIVFLAAMFEVHASKRLCGPVLVNILNAVCQNGYNSMTMTKKSVPLSNDLNVMNMYNDIEDEAPSYAKSLFLDDTLMGDHVNSVAKTRRRRNLLGIYDECCVKGCTYAELTSYCK